MKNEQLGKLLVLLARKLLPLTFAVFILQIDRWELFTCLCLVKNSHSCALIKRLPTGSYLQMMVPDLNLKNCNIVKLVASP